MFQEHSQNIKKTGPLNGFAFIQSIKEEIEYTSMLCGGQSSS